MAQFRSIPLTNAIRESNWTEKFGNDDSCSGKPKFVGMLGRRVDVFLNTIQHLAGQFKAVIFVEPK